MNKVSGSTTVKFFFFFSFLFSFFLFFFSFLFFYCSFSFFFPFFPGSSVGILVTF